MIPAQRRHLDSRRLGALLVDSLLLAPVTVLAYPYEWGINVLVTALSLVYFQLSDCTSGQTVGKAVFKLRTVTLDGEIVGGRAAAARTILRLVEFPIGLVVYLCTGERRQRLGDLAARTAVVDARDVVVERRLATEMLFYPAAWLVPALIVFTLTAQGRFPGSYRVVVDDMCEQADNAMVSAQSPDQILAITRHEARGLNAIVAPPHWRDRHEVLVAEYRTLGNKLERALERTARSSTPQVRFKAEWERFMVRARRSNARLAALGYEGCAGKTSA